MALTVSQYNSILRQYEEHQTRNRHLHDQRLHHIYETVPGYQALDEAVASTSVAQGKRMLAGDTNALAQLKDQLKDLAQKRASLLLENGYPTDFLDPIYDCPDCQDTGYVNGQKCHCFRQAEIAPSLRTVQPETNARKRKLRHALLFLFTGRRTDLLSPGCRKM